MKQKIEALTSAFNIGVDYALHHKSANPHVVKGHLKRAIEKGLAIMAPQPATSSDGDGRGVCPKCKANMPKGCFICGCYF